MRLSTILFELYKYRPKITFEHENIRMENISNARWSTAAVFGTLLVYVLFQGFCYPIEFLVVQSTLVILC